MNQKMLQTNFMKKKKKTSDFSATSAQICGKIKSMVLTFEYSWCSTFLKNNPMNRIFKNVNEG